MVEIKLKESATKGPELVSQVGTEPKVVEWLGFELFGNSLKVQD